MMLSDPNHRYNLIWDKVLTTGFLNANKMPLRSHEDIMVFYKKPPTYNPQKTKGKLNHSTGKATMLISSNNNYGKFLHHDNKESLGDMKHPKSILTIPKTHASAALHRTEKPVELIEWIVNTYSNAGDIVLDNTAGSGTLGEACFNCGREFILIENNESDYNIMNNRITNLFINNNIIYNHLYEK